MNLPLLKRLRLHLLTAESTIQTIMPEIVTPTEIDPRNALLAERLRFVGDLMTDVRHDFAPALGVAIAFISTVESDPEYEKERSLMETISGNQSSMLVTLSAIGMSATDAEGKLFREATELDGKPSTIEGGERDHKADKELLYYMLGGLAIRRIEQEDYTSAAIMLAALGINIIRDNEQQKVREEAIEAGVDPKAIRINKVKTLIQLSAAVFATTKIAETGIARHITHAGLAIGAGFSLVGHLIFRNHIHSEIEKRKLIEEPKL